MTPEEFNTIERDPLHWSKRNKPLESCTHNTEAACYQCNPLIWDAPSEVHKLHSSISIGIILLKAKKKYYQGTTWMEDYEYDALESSLRAIDPNNPILSKVG